MVAEALPDAATSTSGPRGGHGRVSMEPPQSWAALIGMRCFPCNYLGAYRLLGHLISSRPACLNIAGRFDWVLR